VSYRTKRISQATDLVERFRRFATETTDQRYIDMFLRAARDIENMCARSDISMIPFSQQVG